MQRTMLLVILSLLATGCLRDSSPDNPAAEPDGVTYLALGDSYTIGESVPNSARWPVVLARKQGWQDPTIIARTGWTTRELSRAMDGADLRSEYDRVTLLIGVNDQFRGGNADDFRVEFRALLERSLGLAGDEPSQLLVVSIPDYGVTPFGQRRDSDRIARDIDAFNRVAREESGGRNVTFANVTPISREAADDRSLVARDGLHPSARMYERWVGEVIAPTFRRTVRSSND